MLYLFRNGQFVRLFAGRMITNVGDSLYFVATMWLVYELTGSTFYTGIAGSLLLLPQALQFLTGPLVDRLPLHRILVTTQLTQAFLVLTIPLTMAYGTPSVYLVLAVIFILELLNQLAYPAHTAALPRIVPAEELVGANAILSFAHQGSNLVFNAAAGLLLPIVGVLSIYLIDSATFLLAGWLFSGLILAARDSRGAPILGRSSGFRNILTEYLSDLNDGLRHVFRTIIAHIMAGSLVATLCMGVVVAILPQYALTRGGAEIYGFLLAAQTGGILLGSVLATKVDHYPLGYLVIVLFAGGAAAWLASILVPWNILSIVLFGLAWIPVPAHFVRPFLEVFGSD